MFGIGVDLLEIKRMEKSAARGRFLTRFFGANELSEYRDRGERSSYIAANFCAKEAFSKAIGTGVRGFELKEVELLRGDLGKPHLVFSGKAAEIVKSMGLEFEASVSHTRHYAVAVVAANRIGAPVETEIAQRKECPLE